MIDGKMIAVVGLGAILPDAPDVATFWNNVVTNKSSIIEVPADRWNVDLYYDPDPAAVDKTYSKIGAFVRNSSFDPFKLGLAIPPKVLTVMDLSQQWAIAASAQALKDFGYPQRPLDPERIGIIFGNANGGESQYRSTFRANLPEYHAALQSSSEFARLPAEVRQIILNDITQKIHSSIPAITEDTMPGELSNIISGRVANAFNFSGANFVTDAACASSLAALQSAMDQLLSNRVDAVLTGGIDHHMGPESYIKFSKIGALSADGSRPYAEGANGFVMGEGAVVMLLRRVEDAERDGDHIYAVIRGVGGSSDGKGKGITAPNPLGQQRAIERAWRDAGINPAQVGLIEGHGTSTKVGDITEVNSLDAIFGSLGLKNGSVALGSVKSNLGHLKSAAGAVGLLKTILALQHHILPPSANFTKPNPNIDFDHLPFRVHREAEEWRVPEGNFRFAGVSSFGFGGTNFHAVLEEYFPGVSGSSSFAFSLPHTSETTSAGVPRASILPAMATDEAISLTQSVTASVDHEGITAVVRSTVSEKTGYPTEMLDLDLDLEADLGIDTVKQAELFATIRTHFGIPRKEDLRLSDYNTLAKVVQFVEESMFPLDSSLQITSSSDTKNTETINLNVVANEPVLKPYQGLFFAAADAPNELKMRLQQQLSELHQGQVPQSYCPQPQELARHERIAIDYASPEELGKRLEKAITAFETNTPALWKALQAHGVYRGSGEPGKVAFLFPGQGSQYVNMLLDLRDTEPVVKETFAEADRVMTPLLGRPLTSYIYTAGGEEEIKQAEEELKNTAITQPAMLTANVAVMRVLRKYGVEPDLVIGHSLGEYAALVAADVLTFAEALEVVSARGREMAKIKVEDPGCMAAISAPLEKVQETIATISDYLVIANINSPMQCVLGGTTSAIEQAINKFNAQGFQAVKIPVSHAFHTRIVAPASAPLREVIARMNVKAPRLPIVANVSGELYPTSREEILDLLAAQVASPVQFVKGMQTLYQQGARIFIESGPKRVLNALAADNLKEKEDVSIIATNHPRKGGKASFNEALCAIYAAGIPRIKQQPSQSVQDLVVENPPIPVHTSRRSGMPETLPITGSVVITGAGLGLPGRGHRVFEDENIDQLLKGDMRIEGLSETERKQMLEKHVTRLVKSEAGAVMEEITSFDQTLKLAGQGGKFDLSEEFGIPEERVEALDIATRLAIGAGMEALRDAGIPLVLHFRRTSKGTYLPDRWKLPQALQDETGVIFASAFPGLNSMAQEAERFYQTRMLESQLQELIALRESVDAGDPTGQSPLAQNLQQRIQQLEMEIQKTPYQLDRKFVFQVLSMGHSQFAEYIGARGPNTSLNAACATTTQAVAMAEDWIRAGRCRRVVVIAGDDVTNSNLINWVGASMYASGAATTEGDLRLAALPFDRRRNGLILGMGAAALVVESEDAARERGVRAIGEILSSHYANSAFHGTRLDVDHVSEIMDQVLKTAEARFGIQREHIAAQTVFVSHETYTPARGGSASAEIHALRHCFKDQANRVIVANTKGFTGHSMGVGIEDVLAIKALETGTVPPIAHIHDGFEPDPELGDLNLSQGGVYNPQYALRLGAGFGSQIAMTLIRKIPGTGSRIQQQQYHQWLCGVSGYDQAEVEIMQRTLRVKSQGVPAHEPASSAWAYGQLPNQWAMENNRQEGSEKPPAPQFVSPARSIIEEQKLPALVESNKVEISQEENEIKSQVLGVVSEKTGYPVEMLDLDLDLEADLGIDTVKQAELFATIRAHYGIPRREDLILAEYNTLAKVIDFVRENLPMSSTTASSVEVKLISEEPRPVALPGNIEQRNEEGINATDDEAIKTYVLQAVSEKTGYPVDMLDLDLDLEADLGIDTVKQAELFATIRTHFGIPRREDLLLAEYNTLAKVIGFMKDAIASSTSAKTNESSPTNVSMASMSNTAEKVADVEKSSASGLKMRQPVAVLLPRLDLCPPSGVDFSLGRVLIVSDEGKVAASLAKKLKNATARVTLFSPAELDEKLPQWIHEGPVSGAYFLAGLDSDPGWKTADPTNWSQAWRKRTHALYMMARLLPDSAFFIAATSIGGLHGFLHPENPINGVISGFVKALKQERPEQLIKVIDFASDAPASFIAGELIAETMYDAVTCEIGRERELRYTFVLQESVTRQFSPLEEGSVCVVSGGSGGITAPVIKDLAKAHHGSFYLLGRSCSLDKNDEDFQKLTTNRESFKTELQQRMKAAGEKITPVSVEQKLAGLERAAGILQLMEDIESAGGKACYLQCDVTNAEEVQRTIQHIRQLEKKVDLFIHAAGIEKSRKLESKTLEEFESIVSVKADGFANLFAALEANGLLPQRVLFFSSVAGRYGNSGQTDYAAANDLLSKYAQWLPVQYPGMQVVSIDWGAWAEVGMASRGYISELMKRAGIEMLNPAEAAPMARKVLESGQSGEVIVAGSLGMLDATPEGSEIIDVAAADKALRAGTPIHQMFSHLTRYSRKQGIVLEAEMDPEHLSFLRDHALNGIPVLPGVVGIEGFSIAAKHIASVLASGSRDFEIDHLENIQFLVPLKFYGNKPRTFYWHAIALRNPGALTVDVSLESDLKRYGGQIDHVIHFQGRVYLTQSQPVAEVVALPPKWTKKPSLHAEEIYRLFFHGPTFQVLDAAQTSRHTLLGKFNKQLISKEELANPLSVTPLLIELCFQTAALWEAGKTGTLALPHSVGSLKTYPHLINGVSLFAEVKPIDSDGKITFDARVVDERGNVFVELRDYRTSPLPYPAEEETIAPLQAILNKVN